MTTTTNAAPITPLDLADCEREPIHIPGSIQPQGLLFVLREPGLEILQASENVRDLCGGVEASSLIGRALDAVLPGDDVAALRRSIGGEELDRNPLQLLTVRLGNAESGERYQAVAHRNDGLLILELEPAGPPAGRNSISTAFNPYPLVRSSVVKLQAARSLEELWQLAAQEVRRITGFDRVMTYRFDEQYNGEVVAEDRAAEVGSPGTELEFAL